MTHSVIKLLLDSPTAADAAIESALALAAARGDRLGILCLVPDPQAMAITAGDAMASSVLADLIEVARQRNQETATAAREIAEKAVTGAGMTLVDSDAEVPGGAGEVTWSFAEGDIRDLAATATRLADLVIAPLGDPEGLDSRQEAIEAALMDGGAPVLVVPNEAPFRSGTRIAVGWDGGLQSARALRQALPLLSGGAVTLISVAETPPQPSPEAAAAYLRCHGIEEVHTLVVPPDYREIGEALASEAQAIDCGLLVMGGYGHSRLRELVLGGATRWVLAQAPLPVLLLH